MKIWNKLSHSKRGPVQDFATVFQRQIEADRVNRGIPTDLEGFRAKFQRNLIGYWKTDADEFATTEWRFLADGTAQQLNQSLIVGNTESNFLWRERADFYIEMRDAGDVEDSASWFPIRYNFKSRSGQVVLFQVPENPNFKFYLTTSYPVFQGDQEE